MAFACTIPARPSVELDDAAVRITRWDFEPGAATGWHRHGWPYIVVLLTDATLRVQVQDEGGERVVETPFRAGQSYRRPEGIEHDVMNGSDHPIAFIEIEIKDPSALV